MKKFITIMSELVNAIVLTVTSPIYICAIEVLSILTYWGITGTIYVWAPTVGFMVFRTYKDQSIDYYFIEYSELFKKH